MSTTPVSPGGKAGGGVGETGSGSDNALVKYLIGVRYELEPPRTVWPTRSELFQMTRVVLVIIFLIAAYCGALDGILNLITNHIFIT